MASFRVERIPPYSPLVPSPLRPDIAYNAFAPRTIKRPKVSRINRKTPNPVSLTQRLLRQKAAAAWRSEKEKIEHVSNLVEQTQPQQRAPFFANYRPQNHVLGLHNDDARARLDFGHGAMTAFVTVPLSEKTALLHESEAGFHLDGEGLRTHRHYAGSAMRKLALVIAMLCLIVVFSVLRLQCLMASPTAVS
jgi:hypothetical protein